MIISINKAIKASHKYKEEGRKIGLITGCFDIIHIGHIRFFQEAKKNVDILFVGVESDGTIKTSKGNGRPINPIIDRLGQLSELKSVDFVFPIENIYSFGSKDANIIHENLLKKIKPDFLITASSKDKYVQIKRKQAVDLNIGFIEVKIINNISSSEIIKKLLDT